jgi:Holliday junction resolvase-like predicted endonuclease
MTLEDRVARTPTSPKGRIGKGAAGESMAFAAIEAQGWKCYHLAQNEPGGDIIAACPGQPWRDTVVEVKTRPWARLSSPERRGCAVARERARDAGKLYRVIAKKLNEEGFEAIMVKWSEGQARLVRRMSIEEAFPADAVRAAAGKMDVDGLEDLQTPVAPFEPTDMPAPLSEGGSDRGEP